MRSLINFALNVFAIAVALWAVVAVIPGITITPAAVSYTHLTLPTICSV